MPATFARLFLALGCLIAAPVPSQGSDAGNTDLAERFAALQKHDAYLQQTGWRLLTGNASFCTDTEKSIGMLVQDAGAYGQAKAIRNVRGIEGDFFVQAVVPGAGADQAGITVGAELIAVDGKPLRSLPLSESEPWQRLVTINRMITESLGASGTVALSLLHAENAGAMTARGNVICAGHFELISNSANASTNGYRVAIGEDSPAFAYPEAEFAALLAHELAHVVLGHTQWLDKHGRKRKNVRQTEREADRLMPWLLANAGYPPEAALQFMNRWGPRHSGGIFRKRTHDGWDERAEFIAAELPLVAQSMAQHGSAHWPSDFARQPGIIRAPN
ncbi:PDZ domain-containing protein [Altererythrobacter sp. RZ02]|uniref:PDZ domain-containing protein n=1 Tax=Pontixanthobacter rizhaonensis TaxID=2730337 RepID=A0A848QPZ6_9SPHN|nr:PDZ domain-containing protein [Pontixanthobacter rizhaonensis]NMW32723.1 PDZ domain-containing protein [Pontixanthobacter rizhaonensis]